MGRTGARDGQTPWEFRRKGKDRHAHQGTTCIQPVGGRAEMHAGSCPGSGQEEHQSPGLQHLKGGRGTAFPKT